METAKDIEIQSLKEENKKMTNVTLVLALCLVISFFAYSLSNFQGGPKTEKICTHQFYLMAYDDGYQAGYDEAITYRVNVSDTSYKTNENCFYQIISYDTEKQEYVFDCAYSDENSFYTAVNKFCGGE